MSDKCECRARMLQLISGSIGLMNHNEFQQTVLAWWGAAMPELAKDTSPCPCDKLRAEIDDAEYIKEKALEFGGRMEEECEQLRAELAALTKTPDVDDWRKLIQLAYLDGGDGVTRINRITTEYNRVRDENDKLRAKKALCAGLRTTQCCDPVIDGRIGELIEENDKLRAENAVLRKQIDTV